MGAYKTGAELAFFFLINRYLHNNLTKHGIWWYYAIVGNRHNWGEFHSKKGHARFHVAKIRHAFFRVHFFSHNTWCHIPRNVHFCSWACKLHSLGMWFLLAGRVAKKAWLAVAKEDIDRIGIWGEGDCSYEAIIIEAIIIEGVSNNIDTPSLGIVISH